MNKGTNRWLVIFDDPGEVSAQDIQKGLHAGLNHFIGEGWSGATVEEFSRTPLKASNVLQRSSQHYDPTDKAWAVVSFHYDGRKPAIDWPYFGGLWMVAPFVALEAKLALPKTTVEMVSEKRLSDGSVLRGFSDGTSTQVMADGTLIKRTVDGQITFDSSERLAALAKTISAGSKKSGGGGALVLGTIAAIGTWFLMKRKK